MKKGKELSRKDSCTLLKKTTCRRVNGTKFLRLSQSLRQLTRRKNLKLSDWRRNRFSFAFLRSVLSLWPFKKNQWGRVTFTKLLPFWKNRNSDAILFLVNVSKNYFDFPINVHYVVSISLRAALNGNSWKLIPTAKLGKHTRRQFQNGEKGAARAAAHIMSL